MTAEFTHTLAIALTGGMASGKSTVLVLFERLGCTVFDADVISREVVAKGQPALAEIVSAFGPGMLTAQGALDRRRMRERIFANADARCVLEGIIHPRVRSELHARARACKSEYCLLAIPLLAESGDAYAWVDRVLVVDVPRETQLQRLMLRDGMTIVFAEQALAAQASRAQRLALADDVIDNAGSPDALAPAVARLHGLYLQAAAARHPAP